MATANEIIDYAMPLMNIERMAKQVYDRCLEGDLAAAEEIALQMGVEARVLQVVLAAIQNKEPLR